MLSKIAGALLLLFLAALPTPAAELPRSGNPVFDRTVRLVVDSFYDRSALDRFEDAVRREIEDSRSPVTAASPAERVDTAIDAILASLQVSHTGRFRPDGIDYFELADVFRYALRADMRRLFSPDGEAAYAGIGMIVRQGNGLGFVSEVYDGSPAARAGILVGDEVISVDGAPYREIISFRGKAGQTVEIKLRRRPGDQPLDKTVQVKLLRPLPMFEKAIEDSATIMERDGRKIGYIRLWTLAAPRSMNKVAEALARGPLEQADGLVLDLRGRWGGGSADAAELFLGGTPPFRLIQRDGEAILANVRWRRPVVAIIDEGTRSGLEVFAYALKAKGVRLVGARSAGALLAGRVFLLPDDSLLELAVSDAVIGDDTRLEGRGVQPDLPVPFILPYAAGRDPQRDAAVDEMRRILADG
ncbi:S41 family peptidase [Mesorhizobium sp. L-8-3]|uniref:S41 family peptidase n=1 Tax=Mesorhizobium sp. L-8-3 TaxID=2744522 RepID=UPI001925EE86|nr:S41 family peptidase [Mesorhizobium sp. L-8-3]BCH26178.1 carboxyl-terminal processing protease [Mesorhizobium sp. L-8-3]